MDSLVNARCICLSYIDCLHAHGRIKSNTNMHCPLEHVLLQCGVLHVSQYICNYMDTDGAQLQSS